MIAAFWNIRAPTWSKPRCSCSIPEWRNDCCQPDRCYLDLPGGTSTNKSLNRNSSQLWHRCLGDNKDANSKAPTSLNHAQDRIVQGHFDNLRSLSTTPTGPTALRMFPSLGSLISVLWDRLWRWSTKRLPPAKAKHDAFKMCRVTAGRGTMHL